LSINKLGRCIYSTTVLVFTQLLFLYFQFVSGNFWLCFKNGVKQAWQTNKDLHHKLCSHHSQSHESVLMRYKSLSCLILLKTPRHTEKVNWTFSHVSLQLLFERFLDLIDT
jgi:hypothetical protein